MDEYFGIYFIQSFRAYKKYKINFKETQTNKWKTDVKKKKTKHCIFILYVVLNSVF